MTLDSQCLGIVDKQLCFFTLQRVVNQTPSIMKIFIYHILVAK